MTILSDSGCDVLLIISICVHVPMSLRARASAPDGWLKVKLLEKVWICVFQMLTGYLWGTSYICLWFIVILAHSLNPCNILIFCDLRRQPRAVQTRVHLLVFCRLRLISGTAVGSRLVYPVTKLYIAAKTRDYQSLAVAARGRRYCIPTTTILVSHGSRI